MSPLSVFGNSRWRPKWPPSLIFVYNCVYIQPGMISSVSKHMFLGSRNPFKPFSSIWRDHVLVNPRWLPKWPPLHIFVYNFVYIQPGMISLVSKHMFWGSRNPFKPFSSTWRDHVLVNPRWLPKWTPLYIIIIHNFVYIPPG